MQVLLYVVSLFFLFIAAAGLARVAAAPALPGFVLLVPMLGLGVYVFALAGQYRRRPRRTTRAFLRLVGVLLLLWGVALIADVGHYPRSGWHPSVLLFALRQRIGLALLELSFALDNLGIDLYALVVGLGVAGAGAFALVKGRRYTVPVEEDAAPE
jgi:hypothetical protein